MKEEMLKKMESNFQSGMSRVCVVENSDSDCPKIVHSHLTAKRAAANYAPDPVYARRKQRGGPYKWMHVKP